VAATSDRLRRDRDSACLWLARSMLGERSMTSATLLILMLFLLASPAAASRRDPDECLRLASRNEVLKGAIRSGSLASVHLSGAGSVSDDAIWNLVGGPPSLPLSKQEAIALVARLAQTGLFSAVEIRTLPGDELEIALTEHPRLTSVQVRGLSEFRTEDILDRLLEVPADGEIEKRRREVREARTRECPAPLPPRQWLARVDDGEVRGGVLWKGLAPALRRVLRFLKARGYPLARLEGELTPAGELLIEVDEGRVGGIEVRGVFPHLAREVETELGIRRGDVFSTGELYSALERVERRWPFLRPDRRSRRSARAPTLRLVERPNFGVEFRSERPLDSRPPPRDDDESDDDCDVDEPANAWYGFEGDRIVVYLKSERSRARMQWVELLRHTPVTGFAPGVANTWTIYDPGDRAHLMLDGAVNFNTRRPSREATGGTYLERLNAQERVDWLLGSRVRIPALAIAELGGQIHTLTDTADRWRISPIDSYLYSALINRADREYYRRSGFAAFVTLHLFEMLTLGAEYRRDRYAPLAAPPRVWSVWNQDDPRYGSAHVDEGEMGSAVFRLEYRSEKSPLHRVGSMWRNSETSLVEAEPGTIGLKTVNTVEVADRSLGGIFAFTRVVSDSSLTLETGRSSTLTLRLRGAGGHGLPLQMQEGLGGWTALRGYDFKEFRGNASLLGTVQIESRHVGAFLDMGSVHRSGDGWLDPKPSAGFVFTFANGSTHAEAAWRLDGRAKLLPDIRILFAVPL
jgi:hypothetical protein